MALADRDAIMAYIADDNVSAAIDLDAAFEAAAYSAQKQPALYKSGRVAGTREIVVRPTYIMVYRVAGNVVEILRVLHSARRWP